MELKIKIPGSYIIERGNKKQIVVIDGKAKFEVKGQEVKGTRASQQETFVVDIAAPKQARVASLLVNTGGLTEFTALKDGYKFEIGKQLASLELTDKNKFSVTTGAKLGAINIDEKQAVIEYGKAAKISIGAEESKIENNGASVSVKPAEVRVTAPMIYLN
ncbi:MAG: hypothetical protein CMP45_00450 [Rickettsiales bacterium]|nr:hypothetical protein [Rickettsiales bacterium]